MEAPDLLAGGRPRPLTGAAHAHPHTIGPVTTQRNEAIHRLDVLLGAVEDLEQCLASTTVTYRRTLGLLEGGADVEAALHEVGAATTRQTLTDTLEQFEQHRHLSRISLIAAGIEEGMTINGISRAWGISRQLSSRYVKETRGET